jgi:hypothetical protein
MTGFGEFRVGGTIHGLSTLWYRVTYEDDLHDRLDKQV